MNPIDTYKSIQPLVVQDIKRISGEELAKDKYQTSETQNHTHNGIDSAKVPFDNLTNKFFTVSHTLFGTQSATAGNYGIFYIALFPCLVTGASEVHQTAGNDAGDVFLKLEKLTGTQAPDSGTELSASSSKLTSVVVAGGGVDYAVNDTITLTGGTASTQAVLKVLTVTGTAVATVQIVNAGSYTSFPANPVSQGSSSGAGTGATFTITGTYPWFNLKGTANTVQNATLVKSTNSFIPLTTTYLKTGDRLCLKDVGTLTNVNNVTVTVKLLIQP